MVGRYVARRQAGEKRKIIGLKVDCFHVKISSHVPLKKKKTIKNMIKYKNNSSHFRGCSQLLLLTLITLLFFREEIQMF